MARGYDTRMAAGAVYVGPARPSHVRVERRDHLHLGVGPDEPLDRVEHGLDLTRGPGHGGEPELAPLPLVLEPDLGGGHPEPGPARLDQMLDHCSASP